MRVSEVMTRDPVVIRPSETIRRAAQMMDEYNIGAIPVCDGQRLVGMVTDRDITIRATAAGRNPDETPVSEAMSGDLRTCWLDDDVEEAARVMSEVQIRRLPVIDGDRRLVGVVALGDLATDRAGDVAGALGAISEPSAPDR
ncbi:CBS domain-containing protein [Prosthecomicrobium sp. N25]|uniref:CBS domain-containing protein n=1 Tax=Prosthecomicrobium sp. N25 TaxID=3129254 RepID=UPI0030772D6E